MKGYFMEKIKNTKEIEREGGMVWAVDVLNTMTALSKEEAMYWPLVKCIIPWKRKGNFWIPPK